MLKYLGLYILLIPILILLFLGLILINPSFIYVSVFLANFALIFLIFLFRKKYNQKFQIHFFVFPFLFLNSAVFYSLIITQIFLVLLVYVLCSVITYKYFRDLYYFLSPKKDSRQSSLENISAYGNLILVFFFFSGIFGSNYLLGVSNWILAILIIPFISLVIYQVLRVNGISFKQSLLFIILGAFLISELAWVIFFLPYTNISLGLILTICYYVYIGLTRFYLKDKLENRIVNRYLIVGAASIIVIILSSKV